MFSAVASRPDGVRLITFGITDKEAGQMIDGAPLCFPGSIVRMPEFAFVFVCEAEDYLIPLMECEDQLAFSFSERQLRQHGMLAEIPVEESGLTVFIFRGESTESMARDHASLIGPTTVVKDPFGIAPFRKN